jgi:hypothetical protein
MGIKAGRRERITEGPGQHMPSGTGHILGILLAHHHQIHTHLQGQGA